MNHLIGQNAELLEQAATMLDDYAEDRRSRGYDSTAEGAASSAYTIRRLAPALLREGCGCLAQIEEPARAAPAAAACSMPADPTEEMLEVLMTGEDRLRASHGDEQPKRRAKERYRALLALAAVTTTPAAPATPVDDLAALVKQLVQALRKAAPNHVLPAQALDYLRRQGLLGSPLRVASAEPAVDAAAEFPAMTDELASILGMMCFQCISFAQALRASGQSIKNRAEGEQAAVLHWMLGHYFRAGPEGWRAAAAADMERMRDAAQTKEGGA